MISLKAVCIGLVLAEIIHALLQTSAFGQATGYDPKALRNVLLRSAFLTICAAGSAALMLHAVPGDRPLLVLLVAGSAGLVGFVIMAVLMRHSLADETQKAWKKMPWKRLRR